MPLIARTLLGIQILQVYALAVSFHREPKSMCGRHIFSFLDCEQFNGIMDGLLMAKDLLANDWLEWLNNRCSPRYQQNY